MSNRAEVISVKVFDQLVNCQDAYTARVLIKVGDDRIYRIFASDNNWKESSDRRKANATYQALVKANTFVDKWNKIQEDKR